MNFFFKGDVHGSFSLFSQQLLNNFMFAFYLVLGISRDEKVCAMILPRLFNCIFVLLY